jgi:hypothetical protein
MKLNVPGIWDPLLKKLRLPLQCALATGKYYCQGEVSNNFQLSLVSGNILEELLHL